MKWRHFRYIVSGFVALFWDDDRDRDWGSIGVCKKQMTQEFEA